MKIGGNQLQMLDTLTGKLIDKFLYRGTIVYKYENGYYRFGNENAPAHKYKDLKTAYRMSKIDSHWSCLFCF